MPIESTPTLVPELPRPVVSRPLARLERAPFARAESVDPVLRAARGQLASLRLRARAAERAAEQAETALVLHDDSVITAERDARMAQITAEIEEAERQREVALAAAREQAHDIVAAARADADTELEGARAHLQSVVAAMAVGPVLATASASASSSPPEDLPEDEPVLPPAASYPPPAPLPFTGPPSSPVPTVPPPGAPESFPGPVVASPFGAAPFAAAYNTVLIQAPDGTFQQALVLASPQAPVLPAAVQPVAPASPASAALVPLPVAAPAQVAAPVEPATPVDRPSAGRRLLHLDVILPLLAVLIVLVVLLARLG